MMVHGLQSPLQKQTKKFPPMVNKSPRNINQPNFFTLSSKGFNKISDVKKQPHMVSTRQPTRTQVILCENNIPMRK